jgi:hypothetical protein
VRNIAVAKKKEVETIITFDWQDIPIYSTKVDAFLSSFHMEKKSAKSKQDARVKVWITGVAFSGQHFQSLF